MEAIPSRLRRTKIAPLALLAAFVATLFFAVFVRHPEARGGDSHASVVTDARRLTGQVRNASGAPLRAATLCAYGADVAHRLESKCATTDGNGSYLLDLRRGLYTITASANDH